MNVMKNYRQLKHKKNFGLAIMIAGVFVFPVIAEALGGIGIIICIIPISYGVITYIKSENEILRCPHCNKSNSNFSGGGSQAAVMTRLKLTKKCRYCGGDLPEEMF